MTKNFALAAFERTRNHCAKLNHVVLAAVSNLPLAVAVALLTSPVAAWACPMCEDAVSNDPTLTGFFWSTVFLMAVPFTVFSVAGGSVMFIYWRAARRQALTWSAAGAERE